MELYVIVLCSFCNIYFSVSSIRFSIPLLFIIIFSIPSPCFCCTLPWSRASRLYFLFVPLTAICFFLSTLEMLRMKRAFARTVPHLCDSLFPHRGHPHFFVYLVALEKRAFVWKLLHVANSINTFPLFIVCLILQFFIDKFLLSKFLHLDFPVPFLPHFDLLLLFLPYLGLPIYFL